LRIPHRQRVLCSLSRPLLQAIARRLASSGVKRLWITRRWFLFESRSRASVCGATRSSDRPRYPNGTTVATAPRHRRFMQDAGCKLPTTPLPGSSVNRMRIACAKVPRSGQQAPVSDSIAGAGQPSGPAPAGGCSRAAYRNNNADPTNSEMKNPFRAKISTGGLHGRPNPKISTITATNA
jgi:hypothetical protein